MLRQILTMSYYAVAKGRIPGVYRTWPECEAQVKGFSGPKYKKFKTLAEAQGFVSGDFSSTTSAASNLNVPAPSTSTSNGVKRRGIQYLSDLPATKKRKGTDGLSEDVVKLQQFGEHSFPIDDDGYVHVYTDGSCEGNGQNVACAGLGVFFLDGHELNTAKPVKGRATNNCGEIQAATVAIQLAKQCGIKKLQVNTDSNYLIKSVTEWMPRWKARNWKSTTNQELKNLVDFKELDKELTADIQVRWHHVPGHQGVVGNEKADRLAREGSAMYRAAKRS